jgi:hypothetical protein
MNQIGANIRSFLSQAELTRTHFERSANCLSWLHFYCKFIYEGEEWQSFRLDRWAANVISDTSDNLRRLSDASRIKCDDRKIEIFLPELSSESLLIETISNNNIYNICSKISHSFRVSSFSDYGELFKCPGSSNRVRYREDALLNKYRICLVESVPSSKHKDHSLFVFSVADFVELGNKYLEKVAKLTTFADLKLHPYKPK